MMNQNGNPNNIKAGDRVRVIIACGSNALYSEHTVILEARGKTEKELWAGACHHPHMWELIEEVKSERSRKLTKGEKMEMAKLKRDVRAAVIEWIDKNTREHEEKHAPSKIQLSEETRKIKEELIACGYPSLAPVISLIIGEKFTCNDQTRVYGACTALTNPEKKLTGLIYSNGLSNYYTKEGVQTANFPGAMKESSYATREEIAEFFEYIPDNLLMDFVKLVK